MHRHEMQQSNIYLGIYIIEYYFFWKNQGVTQLCSRTLDKDALAEMRKEIPIILVKLEKNFPLAFFDVMIHLDVHLPDEALLQGLV
jgi:hypothetical protein